MDEITFMILKIVVSIAAALVTAFVIPFIKSKMSAQTQELIKAMVEIAVQAAEQTMEGGQAKKEEVLRFITDWLNAHHIKMTAEQLDKLIECIVYEVKQDKKKTGEEAVVLGQ